MKSETPIKQRAKHFFLEVQAGRMPHLDAIKALQKEFGGTPEQNRVRLYPSNFDMQERRGARGNGKPGRIAGKVYCKCGTCEDCHRRAKKREQNHRYKMNNGKPPSTSLLHLPKQIVKPKAEHRVPTFCPCCGENLKAIIMAMNA